VPGVGADAEPGLATQEQHAATAGMRIDRHGRVAGQVHGGAVRERDLARLPRGGPDIGTPGRQGITE